MMTTTVEHAQQDPATARLIAEEALVIDVLEGICAFMERENISRAELARRLGTSKANVTQMLRGRNLGVKTVAAAVHALGGVPIFQVGKAASAAAPPTVDRAAPVSAARNFTVIEGEASHWRRPTNGARYLFHVPTSGQGDRAHREVAR
jgi:transcriptional regulator with XRE-family HTH domain